MYSHDSEKRGGELWVHRSLTSLQTEPDVEYRSIKSLRTYRCIKF